MIKNNHGMIVTVASLAAYLAVPNMVDYASSKAAALSFHEGITAELKTLYNAPKVRTVVVNQGYTRTPLFKGYNGGSPFLMPALEVDTVAEAIVKQVWSGSSGQVIVPGAGGISTLIRALPHWYAVRLRAEGVKFMKKWDGRQVIDVQKWKSGKEAADDVSASTVLVDAATQ
jgi:short-subunit dehydrogenase